MRRHASLLRNGNIDLIAAGPTKTEEAPRWSISSLSKPVVAVPVLQGGVRCSVVLFADFVIDLHNRESMHPRAILTTSLCGDPPIEKTD